MRVIGRGAADKGEVLLITGPAAAGKTTVARRLADESANPSVLLHGDFFAHSLKQGRLRGWLPGAEPQNEVVVEATGEAAGAYASGGYFVVVDAMIRPEYAYIFREVIQRRGVNLHYAVLRPTLHETQERSDRRPDSERHATEVLARIHSYFNDTLEYEGHVIDNTSHDPQQTIDVIRQRLTEAPLPATSLGDAYRDR